MSAEQPTDIEIYLHQISNDDALAWLEKHVDQITAVNKRKGMPKSAQPYEVIWQGHRFQALLFERVVPEFTSIWLDNNKLPWEDDEACALDAAEQLQTIVRFSAGGWQQDADPDAWIEINPQGDRTALKWKT